MFWNTVLCYLCGRVTSISTVGSEPRTSCSESGSLVKHCPPPTHTPVCLFLTGAGETLDVEVRFLDSYDFSFTHVPTPLTSDWSSAPDSGGRALVRRQDRGTVNCQLLLWNMVAGGFKPATDTVTPVVSLGFFFFFGQNQDLNP